MGGSLDQVGACYPINIHHLDLAEMKMATRSLAVYDL